MWERFCDKRRRKSVEGEGAPLGLERGCILYQRRERTEIDERMEQETEGGSLAAERAEDGTSEFRLGVRL